MHRAPLWLRRAAPCFASSWQWGFAAATTPGSGALGQSLVPSRWGSSSTAANTALAGGGAHQAWLEDLHAAQRSRDPGVIQKALSQLDWQKVAAPDTDGRQTAVKVVLKASSSIGNPDIAVAALQCLEFSGLLQQGLGLEGDTEGEEDEHQELGSHHYSIALKAFTRSAKDRSSEALEFLRTGIPEQYLQSEHVNRLIRHAAYRGGSAMAAECVEFLHSRGLAEDAGTFAALMEVEAASVAPEGARAAVNNVWGRLLQTERFAEAVAVSEAAGKAPNSPPLPAVSEPLQSYVSHCSRISSLCRAIRRLPRSSPKRKEVLLDVKRAYSDFLAWHRRQEEEAEAGAPGCSDQVHLMHPGGGGPRSWVPRDRLLKATNQALMAAQALRDEKSFDYVLELFLEAGLEPDIRICNIILKSANRKGATPSVIASMLEDMRSRTGVEPTGDSYAALSRAYVQQGDVQEALDELERGWERGGRFTSHSYDPILRVLAKAGDFRNAEVVYQTMREHKVVPDAVTFAGLFESVVHATKQMPRPRDQQEEATGAFSEADMLWHKQALMDFQQELEEAVPIVEAWLKDMEDLGVKHRAFSIEMLVQAQGNLGQLGSMLRTIGKARASGVKVNVRAYTHAIYALSKCGQLKKAKAIRREMERQGLQSTTVTFDALLQGCLDSDTGIDDASQIVREMRMSSVIPDMRLYNRLIEIHLKRLDVQGAKKWLSEAQNSSLEPNYRTWFVFAGEAARMGDHELLRWAVPKAAATAPDPSKYRPPGGFGMMQPLAGAAEEGSSSSSSSATYESSHR